MGSVPNCRKEIADRYPIRWFKCKLKPPKNLWASTRTHDPFFVNPKIWPTFIDRGEMCKKTLFLSLFLEKRGQIGKKSKKSWCRHQLRTMVYFSKYHTFDPLLYLGCQMLRTHFFFSFSGKNRSNNKIFWKKNLRASTRTHDPFFDNSEIWPTFIYRGEVPAHTFAKLPVQDLINGPKKNWYRHQLQPMFHFLTNHKFDLLSYFYIISFLNLPLRALIHDLQKKPTGIN